MSRAECWGVPMRSPRPSSCSNTYESPRWSADSPSRGLPLVRGRDAEDPLLDVRVPMAPDSGGTNCSNTMHSLDPCHCRPPKQETSLLLLFSVLV